MNMEIKPIYKMYKTSSDTSHLKNELSWILSPRLMNYQKNTINVSCISYAIKTN